MTQDRPGESRARRIAHSMEEALQVQAMVGFPTIIRPSFTLGGTGGGIAYNREEFIAIVERGLDACPTNEVLIEESRDRLERIRDGGGARPQGQLHHRLLDRKLRSDGRAHRRLDHRRAGADADRQGIPDHARRLDRVPARDRRRHRRLERAVRDQSARRAHGHHRDESARVAFLGARLEGDRVSRSPRSPRSSRWATRSTSCANDITGGATPASFEPTIDYVVTKVPRFAFEKFPQADDRLTTQMKSVGEVMAIGRTFQESLQKALRGLEIGVGRLRSRARPIARRSRTSSATRVRIASGTSADAFAHGHVTLEEVHELTHIDPWFLAQIEEIVRHRDGARRRSARLISTRTSCATSSARVFPTAAWRSSLKSTRSRSARRAGTRSACGPVYKRVDTCAAEFATRTAYMYSTYEEECEAQPTDTQEDHGAGRRTEPHRPGHRVRLLLRARGARAARGRLRDHHGQLQPGDGVDRLRHVRPAVLRAADAGRRARDRRTSRSRTA